MITGRNIDDVLQQAREEALLFYALRQSEPEFRALSNALLKLRDFRDVVRADADAITELEARMFRLASKLSRLVADINRDGVACGCPPTMRMPDCW